jgi:hypothetical protein
MQTADDPSHYNGKPETRWFHQPSIAVLKREEKVSLWAIDQNSCRTRTE